MDFEGGEKKSERDVMAEGKVKAKMNKMGSHRKKKKKTLEERMEEGRGKIRTGEETRGEYHDDTHFT